MEELFQLICANLNGYVYPAFCIQVANPNGDIAFGQTLRGRFAPSNQATTPELDRYHFDLLTDPDPCRNLAGVASVIYWGYATFGDNYARNRVDWFLRGHGNTPAASAVAVGEKLGQARRSIAGQRLGEALAHVGTLPQLSRTPFASKVVAFLAPLAAGVYDNRIMRGIADHPTLRDLEVFANCQNGVGQVAMPHIQQRYSAWCAALREIAAGIADQMGVQLRTLDVERALFAAVV